MKNTYLATIILVLSQLTGCIGVGVGIVADTESEFFQEKQPLDYSVEATGDSKWCGSTNATRVGEITLSSPESRFDLTLRPAKNTFDTQAEIWASTQYGSTAFKLTVPIKKTQSSGTFTLSMSAAEIFRLVFNSTEKPAHPFDLFFLIKRTRSFSNFYPDPIPSRFDISMNPAQENNFQIFVLQVNP